MKRKFECKDIVGAPSQIWQSTLHLKKKLKMDKILSFREGDFVLSYMRGWPAWPSMVCSLKDMIMLLLIHMLNI